MGLAFSPLPCLSRPWRASPPFRRAKDAGDPRGTAVPSAHPRAALFTLSGRPEPGPATLAARRSLPALSRPPRGLARPFRRIETGPGTPPPAARRVPLRPFPARPRLPFPGDRNRARQPSRHSESFPAHPHPPRGLVRPFHGDRNRARQPPRRGGPFRPFPARPCPPFLGGSEPGPAIPAARRVPSGPSPPTARPCPPFPGGSEPGPTTPAARRVPSGPFPRGLVRPCHRTGNPAGSPPAVLGRGSFPGSTSPPRAAASLPFPFQACRDLLPAQEEHV